MCHAQFALSPENHDHTLKLSENIIGSHGPFIVLHIELEHNTGIMVPQRELLQTTIPRCFRLKR